MSQAAQDEFPNKGYPSGWFQIAWVGELAPAEVRPIRYFGRDLILYRGAEGTHHVLDAHCLHMGAHLGYGGRVMKDSIVCPYHGWRWGPDGRNEMMPAERRANEECRLKSWKTVVANEIVWVWFDEAGREPFFPTPTDLPGVAAGKRHHLYPNCVKVWRNVKVKPQYIPENNVDIEHLRWIHKAKGPIEPLGVEEDGCLLRVTNRIVYGYGKKETRLTPEGPLAVDVCAELWGLGFQYTFFPIPDDAVSIQAQTPIDLEHCDMFQSVLVYRDDNIDAAAPPTGMAEARVREQLVQIERDIPIWEHMKYLAQPNLMSGERETMTTIRAWARKFYAGA